MARRLLALVWVFLKLGALSFGGPAAHVAMMEREIVGRRGWLTHEEFLDLLGAVNLVPGPNSTEMALHVGRVRAGFPGLIAAGTATIAPAFLCVLALAHVYVRYGARPELAGLLAGVKPVMTALVFGALVRLGRTAWQGRLRLALGAAALAAALAFEGSDLPIVLAAGLLAILIESSERRRSTALFLLTVPAAALAVVPTPGRLFAVFLKIGGTLFGSGYVLVSYMRADLVVARGWLTEGQLLDAIAVGQVTPGPLFTSATFVGYLLCGGPGAIAATVGIFLPAFVLVAASGPLVPRLRASKSASAFLDGVNAASVALMAAAALRMFRTSAHDLPSAALFVLASLALFRTRINPTWLVVAGAAFGLIRALI